MFFGSILLVFGFNLSHAISEQDATDGYQIGEVRTKICDFERDFLESNLELEYKTINKIKIKVKKKTNKILTQNLKFKIIFYLH